MRTDKSVVSITADGCLVFEYFNGIKKIAIYVRSGTAYAICSARINPESGVTHAPLDTHQQLLEAFEWLNDPNAE